MAPHYSDEDYERLKDELRLFKEAEAKLREILWHIAKKVAPDDGIVIVERLPDVPKIEDCIIETQFYEVGNRWVIHAIVKEPPVIQVWRAGRGFYEELRVTPVRPAEKEGRVVCKAVDETGQEVVVDTTGDMDESEFWPVEVDTLRRWLMDCKEKQHDT